MSFNVDRSNPDQFYRYKMPRLIAKVEGSGNGIKTVVANIVDIGKALDRPPTYPLKYFGYELGAQTIIDSKNDRFIVNGAHEANRLQDMLDGFIKKFVLCPSCNNPETTLQVSKKKDLIRQVCAACGHSCLVDMKHKLTTYVLKNPPTEAPKGAASGDADAKKVKGKSRDKKESKGTEKESKNGKKSGEKTPPQSPGDEDEAPSFDVDVPPPVTNGQHKNFEDDWGSDADVTEEAVNERMQSLTTGIKSLTLSADLEKTEDERLDVFYEFVKDRKEKNQLEPKELVTEAERLDVKIKAPLILARVLFDENMMKQIPLYRKVFLHFTLHNDRAQKYLLGGFEQSVAHTPALMTKVPSLLKKFYDEDILEEEVLLDWNDKVTKKYVAKTVAEEIRGKAEPFMKWLKEAEEEESTEEEEEAVAPAPIAKKPIANGLKTATNAKKGSVGTEDDGDHEEAEKSSSPEEDDIDIDAI